MTERVWIIKEDSHHKGTLNRGYTGESDGEQVMILNVTVKGEASSDAERLAIAVLQGSTDAALALADEVQMAFKSKGKYRTREQIIKEHEALLDYATELKSQLVEEMNRNRQIEVQRRFIEGATFHQRAKYE